MNWQDLMPTGLALTTGVPVLLIGTSETATGALSPERPGIVIDANSLYARVLLVIPPAKLAGNVVKRSLFECKIDLGTDLGFYYALRQLSRIQKEGNTQVDLTALRTTDPTDEDRVALARALARTMETA